MEPLKLKGWSDRLKQKFWWFRGAVAGVTVATIVLGYLLQFTPLERSQIFGFVHALLGDWNRMAAWIGNLIGEIPLLPELRAGQINALLLMSVTAVPAALDLVSDPLSGTSRYAWLIPGLRQGPDSKRFPDSYVVDRRYRVTTALVFLWWGLFVFQVIVDPEFVAGGREQFEGWEHWWLRYLALTAIIAAVPVMVGASLAIGIRLWRFSREHPAYPQGFLFVFGFLAVCEVLYVLNLPVVGEFMDTYTCSRSAQQPGHCKQ